MPTGRGRGHLSHLSAGFQSQMRPPKPPGCVLSLGLLPARTRLCSAAWTSSGMVTSKPAFLVVLRPPESTGQRDSRHACRGPAVALSQSRRWFWGLRSAGVRASGAHSTSCDVCASFNSQGTPGRGVLIPMNRRGHNVQARIQATQLRVGHHRVFWTLSALPESEESSSSPSPRGLPFGASPETAFPEGLPGCSGLCANLPSFGLCRADPTCHLGSDILCRAAPGAGTAPRTLGLQSTQAGSSPTDRREALGGPGPGVESWALVVGKLHCGFGEG